MKCAVIAGFMFLLASFPAIGRGAPEEIPPPPQPTPPEPLTILTGSWHPEIDLADTVVARLIQQRTNTDFTVIATTWYDVETKQHVLIASGDYPDILTVTSTATEAKYGKSGLLLALDDYWGRFPHLASCRPAEIWDLMTHPDGHVYAIPTAIVTHNGGLVSQHVVPLYRGDWLREFGLETPETLLDYMRVAEMVTFGDPDHNGLNDTYALGGAEADHDRFFGHIYAAFGTAPNAYFERDGRVVAGSIVPEAKAAVSHLHSMYERGMIDPDYITDNEARFVEKIRDGVFGAANLWAGATEPANNNLHKPFRERNPDGEYVVGPFLSAGGFPSLSGTALTNQRGWMRTGIVAKSDHLEAALRVLDFVCSPAGSMLHHYGIENEHYTVESDGRVAVRISESEQATAGVNLYQIPIVRTAYILQYTREFQDMLVRMNQQMVPTLADHYLLPEVTEHEALLRDYTDDLFNRMIVGVLPVDGAFERFVEEWNQRGGAQLLAAMNRARDMRQTERGKVRAD
jgi:ABC-type glycerol-3-phosphate transport system substrate-binding protein